MVLLAAPGLPGDEMMVQQAVALTRLQTSNPATLATITQNPDNAQARTHLLALLTTAGASPAAAERAAAQMTTPGYRALLADRPAQTLAQVHCPVLALNGSRDMQVVAAPNLAALR